MVIYNLLKSIKFKKIKFKSRIKLIIMISSKENSKKYHKIKTQQGRQHYGSYYSFKKINDLSIFYQNNFSKAKPVVILTESNKYRTHHNTIKNIKRQKSLKKLNNKYYKHVTTINSTTNISEKILVNRNSGRFDKITNKKSPKSNIFINIINNNSQEIKKIKELKKEAVKFSYTNKINLKNKIQKLNTLCHKKESKKYLLNKNDDMSLTENLYYNLDKKKSHSNGLKNKIKMYDITEKIKIEKPKLKNSLINKTKLSEIKKYEILNEIKTSSNLRKNKYLSIFDTINTTLNDIKKLINDVYKKNGLLNCSINLSSIIDESMIFNDNIISLLNNNNDPGYLINLSNSKSFNSTIYNDFSFEEEKQN